MRMTYACHRSRALHLLNPPGRTKHRTQAAPEGAPGYAALCPIPGGEGPKTAHQAAPEGTPGRRGPLPWSKASPGNVVNRWFTDV